MNVLIHGWRGEAKFMLSSGQLVIYIENIKTPHNFWAHSSTFFASYLKEKPTDMSKVTCISISSTWKMWELAKYPKIIEFLNC